MASAIAFDLTFCQWCDRFSHHFAVPLHNERSLLSQPLVERRLGVSLLSDQRYGKWESIATRFYRWQKADIWKQVLEDLQADADKQGNLDWEVHYVDGTVIRAHQHAESWKKGAKKRRN